MENNAIGLICLSHAWGGLEMHVAALSRWMSESGRKVLLFAYPDTPLHNRAAAENLDVIPLKSKFRYGDIINARRLAGYIKKYNIGYLTVHRSPDILVAVLAKLLSKSCFKLVFSQHMHIGNKKDFFHTWEYRYIDAWITPLKLLAEQTRQNTVLEQNKIHIAAQGIELERFLHNEFTKKAARNELNLPEDEIIIGLIGRLDPQKGQMTLVKALPGVHKEGHKVHLLFVGEPTWGEHADFRSKLEESLRAGKLRDYAHFRPFQENPARAYAAMDIFVLGSYSETYGLVTIEAMAAGLPVIGTRSGGTQEIIDDGETGLLFNPRSHEQLAEKINELLENPERRKDLAENARKKAAEMFSHKAQVKEWSRILDSLQNPE